MWPLCNLLTNQFAKIKKSHPEAAFFFLQNLHHLFNIVWKAFENVPALTYMLQLITNF